jgi:hypothetical protein
MHRIVQAQGTQAINFGVGVPREHSVGDDATHFAVALVQLAHYNGVANLGLLVCLGLRRNDACSVRHVPKAESNAARKIGQMLWCLLGRERSLTGSNSFPSIVQFIPFIMPCKVQIRF